jgi:hypothetical protein
MTIGLLFWVLMLIWLIFGFTQHRDFWQGWGPFGFTLFQWILLALLGWKVFGPMLHA